MDQTPLANINPGERRGHSMVPAELQCAHLAAGHQSAPLSANSRLGLEHGNQQSVAVISDPVAESPLVGYVEICILGAEAKLLVK